MTLKRATGGIKAAIEAASKRAEEDALTGWARGGFASKEDLTAPAKSETYVPRGWSERSDVSGIDLIGEKSEGTTFTMTTTIASAPSAPWEDDDATGSADPEVVRRARDLITERVKAEEARLLGKLEAKKKAERTLEKTSMEDEDGLTAGWPPRAKRDIADKPRDDGLPLNLLDKLLIHVRTPGNFDEDGDRSWAYLPAVSNYGKGWSDLQKAGLIESSLNMDASRFTVEGLRIALERNVSDKALSHTAAEVRKEAAPVYSNNPMFGLI